MTTPSSHHCLPRRSRSGQDVPHPRGQQAPHFASPVMSPEAQTWSPPPSPDPHPGKHPSGKSAGSRESPGAQHHPIPGLSAARRVTPDPSPAPSPPVLTPGLSVVDSSVIFGEELGLGPQCPRERQQP